MRLHPPATLAVLRRQKEDNLPHNASVLRPGVPVRGDGGMTRPGVPVKVADYPCRAALVSEATEEQRADALALDARFIVVFAVTADVQDRDILEVVAPTWGKTIEVVGLAAPGARLARVVYCREPRA